MNLWCIYIDVVAITWRVNTKVVHKSSTYFEENFNAVNKKKHDDNEQKQSIASVEDAVQCIFVVKKIRWQNLQEKILLVNLLPKLKLPHSYLSAKKTVRKKVKC